LTDVWVSIDRRVYWRSLWAASLVVVGGVWAAHAQAPACAEASGPTVAVSADPSSAPVPFDQFAVQLGAGLARSGIGVCTGDALNKPIIARIELEGQNADTSTLRIRVTDNVTDKMLYRSVDLTAIPLDSRAVAVAVYVEEVLEASWAELALQKRVFLQQYRANAPTAVTRMVETVLPATADAERRLRLSLGGAASIFHGGARQIGPDLSVGWGALPWLEPALRLGYRTSARVSAPDGTIKAQAVVAGAFIDLIWPITAVASGYFPQGLSLSRVIFVADSHANARAQSATRLAIFTSHGAGARLSISRVFSASAFAQLCLTLQPARASDNGRTIVAISGVGGEAGLGLDARF
jgi:hypothetical protein